MRIVRSAERQSGVQDQAVANEKAARIRDAHGRVHGDAGQHAIDADQSISARAGIDGPAEDQPGVVQIQIADVIVQRERQAGVVESSDHVRRAQAAARDGSDIGPDESPAGVEIGIGQ